MNGVDFGIHKLVNKIPTPADDMAWPADNTVAKTTKDGVLVSTVFLVIDHGFNGSPLWFETMVFGGEWDQECDRYATYEAAEKGHVKMCEKVFG